MSMRDVYVVAFFVGFLAGTAELISRNFEQPLASVWNPPGMGYAFLNGCAALLALRFFGSNDQGVPLVSPNVYLNAILIASGSMLFLRSKFLSVRGQDGKDVPVGPSLILEPILKALDQEVARSVKRRKNRIVTSGLQGIDNEKRMISYIKVWLLLQTQLNQEEKRQVSEIIQQFQSITAWESVLKVKGLGLAVFEIAGESGFLDFAEGLRGYLERPEIESPLS
jgi:hypothetical protein